MPLKGRQSPDHLCKGHLEDTLNIKTITGLPARPAESGSLAGVLEICIFNRHSKWFLCTLKFVKHYDMHRIQKKIIQGTKGEDKNNYNVKIIFCV